MNGEHFIFGTTPDLTGGSLITSSLIGIFVEVFVLAEANKILN